MIEVIILIPVADNDGIVFSGAHHAEFEAFVSGRSNGVTRLPDSAKGVWVDGSKVYHDITLMYLVAIDSIVQGALIGEFAEFAKKHYRQETIFVRYLGVAEII